MLTPQAFNALLKTLEEPPEFVKFILATTDPLKLPATILSRVQHFRFKKIPQNMVLKHLEHILNLEKVDYELEALNIIARSGAGSLRDSLTLLDQAIVYSKNYVDMSTVTGMLGIIEPSLLDVLLNDILHKDTNKILSFIQQASEYEAEMILDELTLYLKELLLTQNSKFTPMIIERFFRVIADSKSLLALGSDGEFVLTLALFKMIEALEVKDIDAMIKSLEKELQGVEVTQSLVSTPTQQSKPKDKTIFITKNEILQPIIEANIDNTESIKEPKHTNLFEKLISKIYDRDFDLGECFKNNIEFESFENSTLTWNSSANNEDKNILKIHWGIINMFVKETFGLETKIINRAKEEITELDSKNKNSTIPAHNDANSGSMIEDIEMKSSCIAPDAGEIEAAKEKDPSTLLEEPMVKEAIAKLDPKKVRIKRNM